jgi:hypothetical protein
VAQKLHDTYNYSYDNLKVLLGGWNTWNQEHAKDANAYPVETGPGSNPLKGGGSSGGGTPIELVPEVATPAPTPAP